MFDPMTEIVMGFLIGLVFCILAYLDIYRPQMLLAIPSISFVLSVLSTLSSSTDSISTSTLLITNLVYFLIGNALGSVGMQAARFVYRVITEIFERF